MRLPFITLIVALFVSVGCLPNPSWPPPADRAPSLDLPDVADPGTDAGDPGVDAMEVYETVEDSDASGAGDSNNDEADPSGYDDVSDAGLDGEDDVPDVVESDSDDDSIVDDAVSDVAGDVDSGDTGADLAGLCNTVLDCDDDNQCTEELCDPYGHCQYQTIDIACEDGNLCTTGDFCTGGECKPGEMTYCDDSSECTADSCNPDTGECEYVAVNGCVINGECVDIGTINSVNICEKCDPTVSSSAWAPLTGVKCDDYIGGRALCDAGECSYICDFGLGDCNGDLADGCETETTLNRDHCGACPIICEPGTVCTDSECAPACSSPLVACGGHCVDTDSDPINCGDCGTVCDFPRAVPACIDGLCAIDSCLEGFASTNGDDEDGCECVIFGQETCNGLDDDCNGLTDDVPAGDLIGDSMNCGACGRVCSTVSADTYGVCAGTSCAGLPCPEGFYDSDDLPTNACEHECIILGNDVCNGTDDDCDGDVDEGFELDSDPLNCGLCGHVCAMLNHVDEAGCRGGICIIKTCDDGYRDLDMDEATGCEDDFNPVGELWVDGFNSADPLEDGSFEHPFDQLSEAVDVAVTDSVIYLNGLIDGGAVITSPGLTLIGSGTDSAYVYSDECGVGIHVLASDTRMSGFALGSWSTGIQIEGAEGAMLTGIQVVDVSIVDIAQSGDLGEPAIGILSRYADGLYIQGVTISSVIGGNGAIGDDGGGAYGIYLEDSPSAIVSATAIAGLRGGDGTEGTCESACRGGRSAGVVIVDCEGAVFEGNTIDDVLSGAACPTTCGHTAGFSPPPTGFFMEEMSGSIAIASSNTVGGNPVVWLSGETSVVVEGLDLTSPIMPTNWGRIVIMDSSDVTVSDCTLGVFVGEGGSADTVGPEVAAIRVTDSSDIDVVKVEIEGVTGGPAGAPTVGGTFVIEEPVAGILIRNVNDVAVTDSMVANIVGSVGSTSPGNDFPGGPGGLAAGIHVDNGRLVILSGNRILNVTGGVGGNATGDVSGADPSSAPCGGDGGWGAGIVLTNNTRSSQINGNNIISMGGGSGGVGGVCGDGLSAPAYGLFIDSTSKDNPVDLANIYEGVPIVYQIGGFETVIDGVNVEGRGNPTNWGRVVVRQSSWITMKSAVIRGGEQYWPRSGVVLPSRYNPVGADWGMSVGVRFDQCVHVSLLGSIVKDIGGGSGCDGGSGACMPTFGVLIQGPSNDITLSENLIEGVHGDTATAISASGSTTLLIENNILKDIQGVPDPDGGDLGTDAYGVKIETAVSPTVRGNRIFGVSGGQGRAELVFEGSSAGWGSAIGLDLEDCQAGTVSANLIAGLEGGSKAGSESDVFNNGHLAACIRARDVDSLKISHLTCASVSPVSPRLGRGIWFDAVTDEKMTVEGSIISLVGGNCLYNNPGYTSQNLYATTTILHSCSDGAVFGAHAGSGCKTSDPRFLNPAGLDYRLYTDSIGIDNGPVGGDCSFEPAPNGCRVNMGFYGNSPFAAVKVGAAHCEVCPAPDDFMPLLTAIGEGGGLW